MCRSKSLILVVLFCSAFSFAEGKSFFWGPRFSLGRVDTWHNDIVMIYDEGGMPYSHEDRYKGARGTSVEFGAVAIYRLNDFFEIVGEVNFGKRQLGPMDNGVYYDTVYYDIMGYAHRKNLMESISWYQASVPLLFRFKTIKKIYFDVGAVLNVVLSTNHALGEEQEIDLGTFNTSVCRGSTVFAIGIELPMSANVVFDMGFRFMQDLTRFDDGMDVWMENESLYLESSPTRLRNWQIYYAIYL